MQGKILLISLVIILITVFMFVAGSGNFSEVDISTEKTEPINLIGKSYTGYAHLKSLQELIREVDMKGQELGWEKGLTVCYFGNPDQPKDSIQIFVGIKKTVIPETLPQSYEVKEISGGNVVRAKLYPKMLFNLSPKQVNDKIQEYALEKGYELDSVFVEKYWEEGVVTTEVKIGKK